MFAIWAHLFPIVLWRSNIFFSSSIEIGSLFIAGSRWLCHLSLHCLADLLLMLYLCFIILATSFQCFVPNSPTNSAMAVSSYNMVSECGKLLTVGSQWLRLDPLEVFLEVSPSPIPSQFSESLSKKESVKFAHVLPESSWVLIDIIY
jgi:hypothetical protein